ncbi:hypothetical protein JCM3766R1_004048 [Sporobolomyces carnicolor]
MDFATLPPPPYVAPSTSVSAPASPLFRLPVHLQLKILSHVSLSTLVFSVKPACRSLRLAACAVARSDASVRRTWEHGLRQFGTVANASTSISSVDSGRAHDPTYTTYGSSGQLGPRTREEQVFDVYIAFRARLERDRSESVLLLEGGEEVDGADAEWTRSFERDVFGFMQPKARCEDLVIERGKRQGWIDPTAPSNPEKKFYQDAGEEEAAKTWQVRVEDVKVELKLKSAKLLLPVLGPSGKPVWKCVVEVGRLHDGTLEEVSYHLSSEFRKMRCKRITKRGQVSYEF